MSDLQADLEFIDRVIGRYVAAHWILTALGVSSVALRLFARWKTSERRAWGWDDTLILLALIFFLLLMIPSGGTYSIVAPRTVSILSCMLIFRVVAESLNKQAYSTMIQGDAAAHEHYNSIDNFLFYMSDIFNQVTPALCKLSICFLLLRFQVRTFSTRSIDSSCAE